ncbi:hypothetical protein Pcinc_019112 [Petrolisthes cinctipes]|uniref:Uncharacterized protein n=1 Tax=Petrolisthes cinctipes TaxID=88211 RepID=A0AAE1FKW3_PETCI|nr:hypothetical protein Pcinc_019112 [Petrolisthes cinctipes]
MAPELREILNKAVTQCRQSRIKKDNNQLDALRDKIDEFVNPFLDEGTSTMEGAVFPITKYPLSLAHSDGTLVKSDKSTLLRNLESLQSETITEPEVPSNYVCSYDGGLLLHSVLTQTNTNSVAYYAPVALLTVVCSGKKPNEVHLCLDKYIENSIKDSERKLRGAMDSVYVITGLKQTMRQSGKTLLGNGIFKNELSKFLLDEWKRDHYWNIVRIIRR